MVTFMQLEDLMDLFILIPYKGIIRTLTPGQPLVISLLQDREQVPLSAETRFMSSGDLTEWRDSDQSSALKLSGITLFNGIKSQT